MRLKEEINVYYIYYNPVWSVFVCDNAHMLN